MAFVRYGGIYSPFGFAPRNDPVQLRAANPLPPNAMDNCTGDAGQDGYSRLSRADRMSDQRPDIGGIPDFWGPRMEDER